jgi:hypothetical protein
MNFPRFSPRITVTFSIVTSVALSLMPTTKAAITFVAGDYYSANSSSPSIVQYNAVGEVVGSTTMPNNVNGLTFGPDGLLYATILGSDNRGFSVLAMTSQGAIQQAYSGDAYIYRSSFGKTAIDGKYLYVAGQNQLTRFLLGSPLSGTVIYTNNQIFDAVPLPNGNLLVASAYQVEEITTNGTLVRSLILRSSDNVLLNDIRGIEYNSATNKLFVTEFGHTDSFYQLLRYDATTGTLEKSTTFHYGDDIHLTLSGSLLVGSFDQLPTFFDQDLKPLGTLHGDFQNVVTQLVPEPSSIALLVLALGSTAAWRIRMPRG